MHFITKLAVKALSILNITYDITNNTF